jgi:uncharacterized protein with HEPN domain
MSKDFKEYLRHILDECNYILDATEAVTFDEFMCNETLKRAIVRSLEIMGEATKKIPADIKLEWNSIQWKNIAGMRDRLVHDYMGVNYNIVRDVVQNKIPDIQIQIAAFLNRD